MSPSIFHLAPICTHTHIRRRLYADKGIYLIGMRNAPINVIDGTQV